MRRIIIFLCCIVMIMQNFSFAFVRRVAKVTEEKVIPISVISDEQDALEYIDISEYEDVSVIDSYIDSGKMQVILNNEEIVLDLYDGEYKKEPYLTNKVGTLFTEGEKEGNIVKIKPKEDIKSIISVDGDFVEANLNSNGEIELLVSENAKGEVSFDKEETLMSEIEVTTEDGNRDRDIDVVVDLPYMAKEDGKIEIKNINLDAKVNSKLKEDQLVVSFSNGIPKLNESKETLNYGYFWIDRNLSGQFVTKLSETVHPNSIYQADNYKFTGEGDYLEEDKLGSVIVENKGEWTDYVGVELDNARYIFVKNSDGIKLDEEENIILTKSSNKFDGQWFNTEQLQVSFNEEDIEISPAGKLYSMGELVANTEGWGEVYPNHDWESKESFFNPITGKNETYVKHLKFFYGPEERCVFGGYYTYPYKCTIAYEHYKPIILYSGNVEYEYEEYEDREGYIYNGWIKIRYKVDKEVNDYPPNPPYAVKVDINGNISWGKAKDDYTVEDDLLYEIESKVNDEWTKIGETIGENIFWGDYEEVRIRAKDEVGQYSDWAYKDENMISLTGEVIPNVIDAGDTIDIFAKIKSISDVTSVTAKCDELFDEVSLTKESEATPTFYEIAYGLLCKDMSEPYIVTEDEFYAHNKLEDKIKIVSYPNTSRTETKQLDFEFPEGLVLGERGTIVVPNQNFMETPIEFGKIGSYWWNPELVTGIKIKNIYTGKAENLVNFYNKIETYEVGILVRCRVKSQISINTFEYKDGKPIYITIPIENNLAGEPISVVWNTENGRTYFKVYFGETLVYAWQTAEGYTFNDIFEFEDYIVSKRIKRYRNTSNGFAGTTGRTEAYSWPEMAYLFNSINWLGYKIDSEYLNEDKLEIYNNSSETRAINRILFMNKDISDFAIKKYLKLIKNTNMLIKKDDDSTVLATEVLEKEYKYNISGLKSNEKAKPGVYEIELAAKNAEGDEKTIYLPIVVDNVEPEEEEKSEKEEELKQPSIIELKIGRITYDENERFIEELSKTDSTFDTEGFICAGETLGIILETENSDHFYIDIEGDISVKEFDSLTERFTNIEVEERRKNVGNSEIKYDFPIRINPIERVDETEKYMFLYTVPYKTRQTLESWSTLRKKRGSYEDIDKNRVFDRMESPYKIIIYSEDESQMEEYFLFDVFERWDTILNRDASEHIKNKDSKWRYRIDG